ncbi:MAG: hypothetical protein ACRDGD_10420 [Candidatus Limnocylindria bacterium]
MPRRDRRDWPDWVGYAAAAWSIVYAALGTFWWGGGPGFPFGTENDPAAGISILAGASAAVGAPVITVLGLIGALVALGMARDWGRGPVRAGLLGFGVTAAVSLTLLIPDYRVLVFTAYAPIVLIGAPFGWPPDASLLDAVTGPLVNQFWCIGGGVLWAAASVAYWRRGRGACPTCGRTDAEPGWIAPDRAARWGRWATYVAIAVPVLYAVTRWAWALGIPLGISEEFLREGQEIGLWLAGAALATLAVVGAILTLGLVKPWGETFPRWIPFLGARRVPPALAIIPASIVAILVTTSGIMFWRMTLSGGFPLGELELITLEDSWAALAPELLWPPWGVALGAATLAYHFRRRGRCSRCGRPR